MKKLIAFSAVLLLRVLGIYAQNKDSAVEMADKFRADGKIYVVLAVAGLILTGLFIYLIVADCKISKLEKEIKKK